MANKKVYVVLNGKAGRRGLEPAKAEILDSFKKLYPEVTVEFGITERPMHAPELARAAAITGQYYAVVAAGGDGTVNEVANGMANTGGTMGIIPNGSTNVFCKEVKISSEIDEAVTNIMEGIPVVIDLGKVGDRYFIWMMGVGLESKIAHEVNPKIKKYFGVLAYVISALRQLPNIGYQVQKIMMDDEKQITFNTFNTIVGNATSYDGFLGIKSRFAIKDGFLDVVVFQSWNIVGVLQLIVNFVRGRRDYYRFIDQFNTAHVRVKKMRIETVPNAWVHVDGEIVGQTPIDVEVAEKAVTLIVPDFIAGKKETEIWKNKIAGK